MLFLSVVYFISVFQLFTFVTPECTKKRCSSDFCKNTTPCTKNWTPEDCAERGLDFLPVNPRKCRCCSSCVPKEPKCGPDFCQFTSPCIFLWTPEKCAEQGLVFQPADPRKCRCCTSCVEKPCNPSQCDVVKCAGTTKEKCISQGLDFLPADRSKCRCCDTCVPKSKSTCICPAVICKKVTKKSCSNVGKVYVPANLDSNKGKCKCCASCEDKTKCPSDYCKKTTCFINETPETCDEQGLDFLPADPRKCRCCTSCIPKSKCDPKVCDNKNCGIIYWSPEACRERGLDHLPADPKKCRCCPSCIPKKPDCKTVKCLTVTKEQCADKGQDFLPANRKIGRCCPRCVKRKGCDGLDCNLVDCNPEVTEENCLAAELYFVPKIPKCRCCDSCQTSPPNDLCTKPTDTCVLVIKKDCDAKGYDFVPPNFDNCCPTCEPPFFDHRGEQCDRTRCMRTKCAPQPESECKANQIWVPNNHCTCCDRCENLNPTGCTTNPDRCKTIRCQGIVKKDCDPINQDFIKADGLCNCCSHCRLKKCAPIKCAAVSCLKIEAKDCKKGQTFIPADLKKCRCCAACVKND